MSFKEDLIKARGHIIIITAFLVSLAVILRLEKISSVKPETPSVVKEDKECIVKKDTVILPATKHSPLTTEEKKYAKIAWNYFENNYNKETGLVNSADKYTASTIWDTSSYLMALISAYRLNMITQKVFDERITKALSTISELPLFENELPNKSYSTISKKMVDYRNKFSKKGIGWSAIDISRLMVPFYITLVNYNSHSDEVKKVLKKYNFSRMVRNGKMYGAINENGKTTYPQEGRLGYEQYSAKSLNLFGFDLYDSLNYSLFLKYVNVYDSKIPADLREPEKFGAHNYVVSEPYILDGIEFNWDMTSKDFSYLVYKAQEERFKNEKILTAVSEDNLDRSPYFVYNTIYTDGKLWNCITPAGKPADEFKTISTKAVFGWHNLYNTEYTKLLMEKIKNNYDEKRGWYSGIYEKDNSPNKSITCNTNAIILESLHYKQFGKLVRLYN